MRYLIIPFLVFLFSCENKKDIQEDIVRLKQERANEEQSLVMLKRANDHATKQLEQMQNTREQLFQEIRAMEKTGKNPIYYLTIKSKKSSFTLDMGQHIKDAANAFTFDIPVDRGFYNSVNVGSNLKEASMNGSLWMSGKFGSVNLTVEKKYIKERQ